MPVEIARIMLPGEQIIANAEARVRVGFQHEYRGVVTSTSQRLLFTMTNPADMQPWWWWSEFGSCALTSKVLASELQLRQGTTPSEDRLLDAASTTTITAKKKVNEAIAALWDAFHATPPPAIHGTVSLSAGPDYHCDGCRQRPGPSMLTCRVCGRILDWPGEIQPFIDSLRAPASVLPERFANGRETGNYDTLRTVTMFAVAAYTQGDSALAATMNNWLDAIKQRTPIPATDFPNLPPISGMGGQTALDSIWNLVRQYPEWLANGTGPDRDIFKSG